MNFIEFMEIDNNLDAIYQTSILINSLNLSPKKLDIIGDVFKQKIEQQYQDKAIINYLNSEIQTTLKGGP